MQGLVGDCASWEGRRADCASVEERRDGWKAWEGLVARRNGSVVFKGWGRYGSFESVVVIGSAYVEVAKKIHLGHI